jgi:hypothetical protein
MEINGKIIGGAKDNILKAGKDRNPRTSDRFANTYIMKVAAVLTGLTLIPTIITLARDISKPNKFGKH